MNNEMEFENWQEKSSKRWIIAITAIVLFVLFIGAYYYYIYVYNNAEKALDKISNYMTNKVDESFNNFNELVDKHSIKNPNKLDVVNKGSINIESKNDNIASIDFDVINSPSKLSTSIGFDTNYYDEKLIKGNILIKDSKIFIESSDLFKNVVYSSIENSKVEFKEITSIDDYKYLFTKLIEYYIEALKEADLSTKPSNLVEKNYIINVNSDNKSSIITKLNKLISKDERLNKIIELYEIDFSNIDNFELSVNVNVFSNKIKSFKYTDKEFYFEGIYDGEKYVVKDSHDEYMNVWISEEEVKIELYENSIMTTTLSLSLKDDIKIYLMAEKQTINIDITKEKMSFVYNNINDDSKVDISVNFREENNKRIYDLTGKIKTDTDNMNITGNMESYLEEDAIKDINESDAKDINALTEDELLEVYTNMFNILGKIDISDYIGDVS